MDGRRRAATAVIVVVMMVVVVLVLPSLSNAILSCKEGFSSRTNSTFISPECYKKQWWRAVEQNKVPGMCLPNLQMSTPGQNNVTCRELRTRREAHHPKEHIRDKKTLCSELPAVPAHMVLEKSGNGFLGTCREGYGFSSSLMQSLRIQCQAGVWVKNHSHPCRPQCINQCLNGGTCIDVETCLCPPGTAGLTCGTLVWGTCQTNVKWQNVIVKAIVQGLLLRCPRGYKLLQYKPYEHWLLQCKANGFEEPPGVTWDQDHPCLPVCEPPCHEGATCIAPGKCTCGDGIACADCETRHHCSLPFVLHGAAYRLAPQLSRVSCFGERLPAARSRSLLLRCSKDHWVTASGKTVAGHQMTCSFFCNQECQNGGRCVGLNKCLCRGGFEGAFCGYPVCGSTSLRVLHASYSLRSSADMITGTVRCNDEYRMVSGEQETSFQCLDGTWYFSGDMAGHRVIECHPLCSPPCVNRGTCVAPGHCLCSGGFTGKYCEMRPTTTTDGMRCVFPFSNGHKIYSSCVIADDNIPWCPTQVNLDRQPVAWQMCNTTNNLEQVVGTISGSTCAFPFKWNGTTWWKCAPDEKMRYWCAIHVTTNGHILQADFCWLDNGLSYTQPECQPSTGCPLPSILGNSRYEISFPLYPWAATNTITSTTTPATKPITTMTNEVLTLVIPQIPGMAPLPPVPPFFPFPPHLAHPPSPPNPSHVFPQPQPIPPMPFVPPLPPPMPPPILVLQQPVLPPMPQPVPVFMPPPLQPQPVIQLAPIVPLQQPLPPPPQTPPPSLPQATPLPSLPKAPPQSPPLRPKPLPSLPPALPLPLPPAPPESVKQQQLLQPPPPQSMQAPAPRPLRLLSTPLQLSTPQSTQPISPPQSVQPSPPLPSRYVSTIPSSHQESVLSEPPPPPPPTVRLPSRLPQRSDPERPAELTTQYSDSYDPDEPIPPPTQPSPLSPRRSTARPTPSPSQATRHGRPQHSRRPTSRLDQSKSRRQPKPTEPPIRPTVHKPRRRRPRPTELHASKRHKSRGTHALKPISRPQRPHEDTER